MYFIFLQRLYIVKIKVKNKKNKVVPDRDRTCDLVVNSHTL